MSERKKTSRAISAEKYKGIYVDLKVVDMLRRGIPAEVNPRTGAARPDWKEGEEKTATSENATRILALRFKGRRDIEGGAAKQRAMRPLTSDEIERRNAALVAALAAEAPRAAAA